MPQVKTNVVLEGGAIDADGRGTLLSTEECLLSPVQARNPELSREQMEAALSGGLTDRIIALLQIMLEAQSRNSELFAAAVGHSWMVADPTYQAAFDQMELAWRPIRRVIESGIASGELRQDTNPDTIIAVLSDQFLGAMRAKRRSEYEDRPMVSLEERVRLVIEGILTR